MQKVIFILINFIIIFRIPLEYFGSQFSILSLTLDAFILLIIFVILIVFFTKMLIDGYLFDKKKYRLLDFDNPYLLVFIFIITISSFFSIAPKLSLTGTFTNVFNIICYIFVLKLFTLKQIETTINFSIIGLFIPIIDAYLQFFMGEYIVLKQGFETIRVSGFFFYSPGWFASTLGLYLILFLILNDFRKNKNLFKKIKFKFEFKTTILILFALSGVFILGFRSSIITAMIIFLLFAFFSGNLVKKFKTILISIAIISICLYIYGLYSPGGLFLLYQAVSPDYLFEKGQRVSTFAWRIETAMKYLFNFDMPIFGYGASTFGLKNSIGDSGSLYVNLWFSFGFLGFFSFILFLLKELKKVYFIKKKFFIDKFITILIISAMFGAISESTLIGTRGLYFFILLAIASFYRNKYYLTRRNNNTQPEQN